MDHREHEELQVMLSAFKQDCLQGIAEAYRQTAMAVDTAEASLVNRIKERFSKTEEMLAGPYDRQLQWDWIPPYPPNPSLSFLDFKICLRDLPEFELTAKEYLTKYVKSQAELSQALTDLGYHLPPTGNLFAHFLAEVLEGKKLLVAKTSLRRVNIPDGQIPFALSKAQKEIASDPFLQDYLPSGTPQTLAETLYFLEVVNSFHRLHYKVIFPISVQEEKVAADLRKTVSTALTGLSQAPSSQLGSLRPLLQEVQSPNMYGVSGFIEAYLQLHSKIAGQG